MKNESEIPGLVDNDEGAVDTAKRELEEETGFVADRVITSSPLLVSDPGLSLISICAEAFDTCFWN